MRILLSLRFHGFTTSLLLANLSSACQPLPPCQPLLSLPPSPLLPQASPPHSLLSPLTSIPPRYPLTSPHTPMPPLFEPRRSQLPSWSCAARCTLDYLPSVRQGWLATALRPRPSSWQLWHPPGLRLKLSVSLAFAIYVLAFRRDHEALHVYRWHVHVTCVSAPRFIPLPSTHVDAPCSILDSAARRRGKVFSPCCPSAPRRRRCGGHSPPPTPSPHRLLVGGSPSVPPTTVGAL